LPVIAHVQPETAARFVEPACEFTVSPERTTRHAAQFARHFRIDVGNVALLSTR
jgi:hypothetical protein